ncbi:hypothetical protein CRG98_045091 [Punica granatum]|uniref:Uncharacterized protein n=1 Tax=Punica granatum TaxID=22663 RepID=A0A2I0HS57_PUNGR|nr:hypothetical protein CRG98_045091 [Punica granatum]
MVYDAMGEDYGHHTGGEDPNPKAMKFYWLLENYNHPIWHGCERHSALSIAVRYLSMKCDYNIPQVDVDDLLGLLRNELAPKMNNVHKNFYEAKKLLSSLI